MHAAVAIRGSALPSAVKDNMSHFQPKVFVCVCNQWAYVDNCTDAVDWLLIIVNGGKSSATSYQQRSGVFMMQVGSA